jgi:hypothetical protein
LLGSRRTSTGHVIGANEFVVTLHPEDFAAFASWKTALERELENWLGEVAFRYGVRMLASPQVAIASDAAIGRNTIQVMADFSAEPAVSTHQHESVARLIPLSQPGTVIEVSDLNATVGRAPGNDLVIGAPEVSREHARLRREGNALEVRDLGSRNGTWVNGTRVSSHLARSGDEIAFGTLRFRLDLP